MDGINFLSDRQKKLSKQQKDDRELLRYTQMLFAGVMLIFLVILGIRLFFNQRIRRIEDAQEQARQQILNNEDVERAFVITVNKLDVLNTLFEERQDKQDAINFFTTVFGPNVLVNQIEYNAGESILTFGVQSRDVFVLEGVLERLKGLADERAEFALVNPSNLRRTDDGKYELQVTVTLASSEEVEQAIDTQDTDGDQSDAAGSAVAPANASTQGSTTP